MFMLYGYFFSSKQYKFKDEEKNVSGAQNCDIKPSCLNKYGEVIAECCEKPTNQVAFLFFILLCCFLHIIMMQKIYDKRSGDECEGKVMERKECRNCC